MKRLAFAGFGMVLVFLGCNTEVTYQNPSSSSSSSTGAGGSSSSNSTGSTSGGGAPSLPECSADADCTLIDDCCTCASVALNEAIPDCPAMECFAPACEANSIPMPAPVCRASHCVVNADCNQMHALCKSLPPTCPQGKTPIVVNGCWGGCIEITECSEVGSCSQCQDGQACVHSNTMMIPATHCVDIPANCNGQISCACMGESVCGFAMGCMELGPSELQCLDITTK